MPKIIPAQIHLNQNNMVQSVLFKDIYHSNAGAENQAQNVFLKGNFLPERWQNKKQFSILELGWGFGVNFLVTLKNWMKDKNACQHLNYIAFEKYPLTLNDFQQFHPFKYSLYFAPFLKHLAKQYPPFSAGYHFVYFKNKNSKKCTLTIILGDVKDTLPAFSAQIDAIYLDGFQALQNETMWSEKTLWHLHRLSSYGTTLASWSVAKKVRENLENAEFSLKKEAGIGNKRHRLTGFFKSKRVFYPFCRLPNRAFRTAIVAGAGLAAACCAHFLVKKNFNVQVLAPFGIADGASGNWSGLAHPLPSIDDNHLSQLSRQGYYFLEYFLQKYPHLHQKCGILHLSSSEKQAQTMQKIVENGVFDQRHLYFLPSDSHYLNGIENQYGALFYPNGICVQPFLLCQNLMQHPHIHIVPECFNPKVHQADVVILAMGKKMIDFLPLILSRGQVHFVENAKMPLKSAIVSRNGYIVPQMDGKTTFGASFVLNESNTCYSATEEKQIFNNLKQHFPHLEPLPNQARASVRVFSPKRLPIVGKMPHRENTFCLTALGARGLIFAPLLANFLIQEIVGEFSAMPSWAKKVLSPEHFF